MKKIIASVLIAGLILILAACTAEKQDAPNTGSPFSVETVIPPAIVTAGESKVMPISVETPAGTPKAVILTCGNEDSFTLGRTFDYDAFIGWLAEYFGALYDEPPVVAVRDIIDGGDEGERGTVTVLAEYHAMEALESGRGADTVCGGCNLFFQYDRETGADFCEMKFAGDVLLHNRYVTEPRDLSDWTATVDTRGYVQLVKAGRTPIKTPAEYRWDLSDFADVHQLYVNGDRMMLVLLAHDGTEQSVIERPVYVYTSNDGGATWSETELDYTPTTTTIMYPVTDIVLNMRDDDNGTVILGTNRCEVFFYTTGDGGKSWTKQRNFKLLNYQNEALLDGGMVTDSLGFITFEARDADNPNVYITYDGGKNWELMDITLPAGYSDADAYGEAAYLENGSVVLPIVCGGETLHYISENEGKTWKWQK